ncbi:MAG: hypothetical protein AAGJ10_09465 [Bacteroidota bacterium]
MLTTAPLTAQPDREQAQVHYADGWRLIMDAGRWTDAEAAFRSAMAADASWVLGRALVARITTDVDERESLLRWIEAHLSDAAPDERLLIDSYVLGLRAANARDRGASMPEGFAEERVALALANFRAYLEQHPTAPYISAELIEWIHHAEGPEAALAALMDEVHPAAAQVPFLQRYRAVLLSEVGRHDEALAQANAFEAAMTDPLAPSPHVLHAQLLYARGRLDEAKSRIETAIAMDAANMTAQGLQRAIDAALAER